MIEEETSSRFSISILDNGYSILITINSQINENKNVTTIKRKEFCFSISLIWNEPKMRKIVTKYVVCYSNN